MKTILFIIGSLRKGSFNRKLAEEAERMLDGRAKVEYLDYSDVPLMNQDFEFPAPEAVRKVREKVAEADALWIFSPEYNYSYLSGAGGALATARCREKLTELLTLPFIRAEVMTEPQTGIQLNREAWTEGRMILTEEQTALLKSQADAFIDFIG